jgi:hypothetical protein
LDFGAGAFLAAVGFFFAAGALRGLLGVGSTAGTGAAAAAAGPRGRSLLTDQVFSMVGIFITY